MTARTSTGSHARRIAARIVPCVVVALPGMAVRTPLATAYPFAALLLFLRIVADTLMLALIARSSSRPGRHAILATLAGACFTVWIGLPPVVRAVLLDTPTLAAAMAAIVLGHVAWAATRARRVLNRHDGDTGERWTAAASEVLPPTLIRLAAAELAVIHMALFRWGGPADIPATGGGFAYHRHLSPICMVLLVLSVIEIAVYHLLVGHWSRTAAMVMFVFSDIGFVYLIGLIKSFRFRPILLMPDGVRIRAGFLIDQFVPLDAIAAVDGAFTGDEIRDRATLNAALLAWPNILLRLDRPLARRSLLVRKSRFDRVAFRLDDPEPFVRLLQWRLGHRPG